MNPRVKGLLEDPETWRSNGAWCLCQRYPIPMPGCRGLPAHSAQPDWRDRLMSLLGGLGRRNSLGITLSRSSLHQLRQLGLNVPDTPLGDQERGVLGLAVDRDTREGFLVPIRATRKGPGDWTSDPSLPFGTCRRLRTLLARLLDCLGRPGSHLASERQAFDLSGGFGIRVDGRSMDVAALLAIASSTLPPGSPATRLLSTCCAIVQPSPGEGDGLVAVDMSGPKLDAFARECDGGSLLVLARGSPVDPRHRALFDETWEVGTIGELAERMRDAGMLSGLLRDGILSMEEVLWVSHRVEQLSKSQDLGMLGRLCQDAVGQGMEPAVPGSLLAPLHAHACSHFRQRGDFIQALERCRIAGELARQWPRGERLLLACEEAWCLSEAHRFEEARSILEPHAARVEADEENFDPRMRRNLWNIQGRVGALLGLPRSDWEGFFARTLSLQGNWQPEGMPRTRVYLAKALGNAGHRGEARELLAPAVAAGEPWSLLADFSLVALEDEAAGRVTEARPGWEQPFHRIGGVPLGILCVLLARQAGRCPRSAAGLADLAEAYLCEGKGAPPAGLGRFLVAACRLARAGDPDGPCPPPWLPTFQVELLGSRDWEAVRRHYGIGGELPPGRCAWNLLRKVPLL